MSKEKDFHRELISDMAKQGVILKKIPDVPVSRVQKYMTDDGLKEFRFSPPKFVDLVGIGNEIASTDSVRQTPPQWDRPLIWEAKIMKKLNAWPLKTLRDEQLKILLEFGYRADSRVIINYRVKEFTDAQVSKYGLRGFVHHKRINCLTSVLPVDILIAIQQGWKSIPLAELAKSFIIRPWGGKWSYGAIINNSTWRPQWP